MTKSEFLTMLAESADITKKQADQVLNPAPSQDESAHGPQPADR